MTRLLWLADALSDAGLNVQPQPGWEKRGKSRRYNPRVIVDHHTAGPVRGSAPSLGVCITGRPGVPGPLCNILTGRDGEVYVIASGRSNNAGRGGAPQWGATHNRHTIGHEVEHAGNLALEPLNGKQLEVIATVDAMICAHLQWGAGRCVAHREWAPGRKIDPIWSQSAHRARVAQIVEGADMSNTLRSQAGVAAMFDAYRRFRSDLPKERRTPTQQAEEYWRDQIDNAVAADEGRLNTPNLDKVVAKLSNALRAERAERNQEGIVQ